MAYDNLPLNEYMILYSKRFYYIIHVHSSVATGSGQSGYPGQMGHFFSGSCGSPGQAQIIRVYNTL